MAIGPDGRPKVREFGNVKPSSRGFGGGLTRPEISGRDRTFSGCKHNRQGSKL